MPSWTGRRQSQPTHMALCLLVASALSQLDRRRYTNVVINVQLEELENMVFAGTRVDAIQHPFSDQDLHYHLQILLRCPARRSRTDSIQELGSPCSRGTLAASPTVDIWNC